MHDPGCQPRAVGFLVLQVDRSKRLALMQAVVSSYEARQEELMHENRGLQAALLDLQSDYRVLANKQAAAQQLRAAAVGKLVEEEDLHSGLQDADVDEVQAELSSRMAAMKSKLEAGYDGPLQQVWNAWCPQARMPPLQTLAPLQTMGHKLAMWLQNEWHASGASHICHCRMSPISQHGALCC